MNNKEFIDKPRRLVNNTILYEHKGFTIIELMIAIGIFAIISISMMFVFDSFERGYTTQQATMDVIQKARSALSFMAYDIKQAGLDPRESEEFRVRTATATQFTFDFDAPNSAGVFDGKLDVADRNSNSPERRTYMMSGGKLYQMNNIADPANPPTPVAAEILVPDVVTANSASRFEYIDNDRNIMTVPVAAANLNLIRAVRIVLTINESSGRGGTVSRTMDTMVRCSNLLYNYNRSKTN